MKFKAQFRINVYNNFVGIEPLNKSDMLLFLKLKDENCDFYEAEFSTPFKKRTFKQLATVWKLVSIIFEAENFRKPTDEESKKLYEDLKEEYAMRRPSSLDSSKLVPVGMSEADTKEGAYFIEGLMSHLAQYCDLPMDAQTEVRALLFEFEYFQGNLGSDNIKQCSEVEYRERHPFSEASGKGGRLHLHHIVSKGSCEALRHITANWVMLTEDEHIELHSMLESVWLEKYPHLKPKFKRAHELQAKVYGSVPS